MRHRGHSPTGDGTAPRACGWSSAAADCPAAAYPTVSPGASPDYQRVRRRVVAVVIGRVANAIEPAVPGTRPERYPRCFRIPVVGVLCDGVADLPPAACAVRSAEPSIWRAGQLNGSRLLPGHDQPTNTSEHLGRAQLRLLDERLEPLDRLPDGSSTRICFALSRDDVVPIIRRVSTVSTMVVVTRPRARIRHGSTTSQPRRCSSPASCSAGMRRSSCSALESRTPGSAGCPGTSSEAACSRAMNSSASASVNLPAAWRCVNRIGPRAEIPEALVTRSVQKL